MTAWVIPKTDRDVANWLRSLDEATLDAFVADADYLLDGKEWSDDHMVVSVVVGAARRWRDEGIDPMETIRSTAPPAFFADGPQNTDKQQGSQHE